MESNKTSDIQREVHSRNVHLYKKEETGKRAVRHTRFVLSFLHDLPVTTAAAPKSKMKKHKKKRGTRVLLISSNRGIRWKVILIHIRLLC
jgi:hypothetical protein